MTGNLGCKKGIQALQVYGVRPNIGHLSLNTFNRFGSLNSKRDISNLSNFVWKTKLHFDQLWQMLVIFLSRRWCFFKNSWLRAVQICVNRVDLDMCCKMSFLINRLRYSRGEPSKACDKGQIYCYYDDHMYILFAAQKT